MVAPNVGKLGSQRPTKDEDEGAGTVDWSIFARDSILQKISATIFGWHFESVFFFVKS